MNHLSLLLLLAVFSFIGFQACKSQEPNGKGVNNKDMKEIKDKLPLIPCKVGNIWVYENRSYPANQAPAPFKDSLIVETVEKSAEGLLVNLNQEKWLLKEDSIFIRCQSRNASEFSMPLFLRCEGNVEYSTCVGDVVMTMKVTKLGKDVVLHGKTYSNCYLFEKNTEEIIVADGIGIIKHSYFGVGNELFLERTLLDYQLK